MARKTKQDALATRTSLDAATTHTRLVETLAWLDATTTYEHNIADHRTWLRFAPLADHIATAAVHADTVGIAESRC